MVLIVSIKGDEAMRAMSAVDWLAEIPYAIVQRLSALSENVGVIGLAIPSFFEIKESDEGRKLSKKTQILFFRSPR
jgi:hypothetical protein